MIHISGRTYELIYEHKNAWNPESFRERYSDVLERYDYVIGDWGYSQLRLKGFFRDNHPKVTRDSMFSSIVDYINEYCNFGCAYFVLQKHPDMKREGNEGEAGRDDEDYGSPERKESSEEGEAASLTAASEEGQEQPARVLPRHQRDPRRERHQRNKDNQKDSDKEQSKEGRKPFAKDRDKRDRSSNGQGAAAGSNQERPRRSNDRERPGKRHFSAASKAAPVAAAAETPAQSPAQPQDKE
ncbi:hypothetical protein PAECIP111893_00248 [Paenibacillus plantiphilus]|uniref:DUF1027 domain-containing protein n=1 Tax=Paenibacillus plantiphilus TaxID=2905650 RepID=A0ABN8FX40_9BACL|nr:YutD family protein [Paenibacillus plantiphilus]CAH1190258.1 hypothetical protein PAECIP111893_00248 [Paenibacillus plantiphilus]